MPVKKRRIRDLRRKDAKRFAQLFRKHNQGHITPKALLDEWTESARVAAQYVHVERLHGMHTVARDVSKPPHFLLEALWKGPPAYERVVALCVVWNYYVPTKRPSAKYDISRKATLLNSDFVVWAKPYTRGITPYQIRKGVRLWKEGQKGN